jgi:hypothetical protein
MKKLLLLFVFGIISCSSEHNKVYECSNNLATDYIGYPSKSSMNQNQITTQYFIDDGSGQVITDTLNCKNRVSGQESITYKCNGNVTVLINKSTFSYKRFKNGQLHSSGLCK